MSILYRPAIARTLKTGGNTLFAIVVLGVLVWALNDQLPQIVQKIYFCVSGVAIILLAIELRTLGRDISRRGVK